MVHAGFPSFGLCSGGSSDPFFSPLCVLSSSALSSLPPRFAFPMPTVSYLAWPECRRRERRDLRLRRCRKDSTFPALALSACIREQNKSKQLFYFQQHTNTYFCNSLRIKFLQLQGRVFFIRSLRPGIPKWDSQSWLSSRSFQRPPNESRPQ
jgi:hypothetical protein